MTCSPRFEGSFLKGWRTVNSVSLNALKRQFISYIDILYDSYMVWYYGRAPCFERAVPSFERAGAIAINTAYVCMP